ncbi:heme-degrading domain-containing protein [Jidongwangia harbinensis]|uniref:heme-degrading domain-containing protein n=1 Tax=Jidongwangia harbinensis TaxID=2878561 RepID=UPI001CD9A38D|nr:heme-degrading domain-containing protein [Jidongwangia harbinensis]MCA2214940.1 heme-degrading domain-containing protein [Jidongwangia harbinensis]
MTDDPHALIARLEDDERRLTFDRFDNTDALALGTLLVDLATTRDLPVTIDIRRGTQQLFHAALPGTTADQDAWIHRKVRVVERYGASSYLVGRRLAANDQHLDAEMGVEARDYAAHGGAFPVRVPHVGIVGVITVSGLPQADDHALVVEAVQTFLDRRLR